MFLARTLLAFVIVLGPVVISFFSRYFPDSQAAFWSGMHGYGLGVMAHSACVVILELRAKRRWKKSLNHEQGSGI